jgi:plastocyanin
MGKVKKGVLVLIVVVAVLVGIGVVFLSRGEKPKEQPERIVTGESTPVPTEPVGNGQMDELTVEAGNFKFVPAILNVKQGDTVRINFKNSEGSHNLVIDEFNVKTNQINEGDEEAVEFAASKAGTFEYYCSVGNHRKMGMVGKLIVE